MKLEATILLRITLQEYVDGVTGKKLVGWLGPFNSLLAAFRYKDSHFLGMTGWETAVIVFDDTYFTEVYDIMIPIESPWSQIQHSELRSDWDVPRLKSRLEVKQLADRLNDDLF